MVSDPEYRILLLTSAWVISRLLMGYNEDRIPSTRLRGLIASTTDFKSVHGC